MNRETFDHIREDVRNAMVENRNDDPELMPELVMWLLGELGNLATDEGKPAVSWCPSCSADMCAEQWAEELLNRAQLRAISKIPFAADALSADDPYWEDHR